MTGTGTKADPFIPESWDELKTAAEQGGVYVRLPEGGIWDLNEQYPEGVPVVFIACEELDGNGTEIRNMRATGNVFEKSNHWDLNTTIKDLTLLNTYITNGTLFKTYTSQNHNVLKLRNVRVAAELYGSAAFILSYHSYVDADSCSFNAFLAGSSTFCVCDTASRFDNCIIRIEGTTSAGPIDNAILISSELRGNVQSSTADNYIYISSTSDASWCDISLAGFASIDYSGASPMVICTDGLGGAVAGNGWIQATSAQMKDAEWLHTHGFPCGRG